jgi:PHD/YefM family antitoxin component YafN of YafNO toxin-antitoxin module
MTQSSVRYLGSRELHRELPRILDELTDQESRLVLTIHAKPKAVLIGADAFATLVRQVGEVDRRLGEELAALLSDGVGKIRAQDRQTDRHAAGAKPSRTAKKSTKSRSKIRVKQN